MRFRVIQLGVSAFLLGFPPLAGATQASLLTMQGTLLQVPGRAPVLKTPEKDYTLSARTDWLLNTLRDERLAHREIRVEGALQPDGTLKVLRFYTVRDGKLFKLRYFCEVCNVEALEPGNCVCCQDPTELQEIPLPDAKY